MKNTMELANLCYNVPGQPIYGELTKHSVSRILELDPLPVDHLVDLGSGSGRTLLHMRRHLGPVVALSGLEVSQTRLEIARAIVPADVAVMHHCDMSKHIVFPNDVTHTYAFDKAFTADLMANVHDAQLAAPNLCSVFTTNPGIYRSHPDHWEHVASTSVRMVGGAGSCTACLFHRTR